MFADHFRVAAKLFVARATPVTFAARGQIMKTDAITRAYPVHSLANLFDDAGNFMAQGPRQRLDPRNPGAIMSV
jgi:hypothetical protein